MESPEHDDLVFVITFLRRNPEIFLGLLTAARLEMVPEDFPIPDGTRKREVEAYFRSSWFGWCSACFNPIVLFPDGAKLDWPAKAPHKCNPEVMDAPKARYRKVAI